MKPVIWLVLVKDGKRWALHSTHTDEKKAHHFAECKTHDAGEACAVGISRGEAEEIAEALEGLDKAERERSSNPEQKGLPRP